MPFYSSYHSPSYAPQFRNKTVFKLSCLVCSQDVCHRGMRALLLADTKTELFSTDCPPNSGNIVGYHITKPCINCTDSCNNGHFWMYYQEAVKPRERLEPRSIYLFTLANSALLWAFITNPEKDVLETTSKQSRMLDFDTPNSNYEEYSR